MICSDPVALVPLTVAQMRALVAGDRAAVAADLGYPVPAELTAGRWWTARADLVERDPTDTRSAVRLVRRSGEVVGNAGFHGPPDAAGMVEIGYEIYPAHRRRGIARAVLTRMVREARESAAVRTVRLSIAPDNEPSLGLARSAGFLRTGEQMDPEDGLELVLELPVGPGDPVPDWRAENRDFWDEAAVSHAAGPFYDLPGFVAGRDDLRPFEDAELGPVAGLDLVHLQCHLGTDTLSWARRGARVTGLDVSAASVALARRLAVDCGLPADFVTADVYDAVAALGGRTFDVVYTGVGALCWLPDLDRWAAAVAALLRPGAVLYLVEVHPLVDAVWDDGWTIRRDMLGGGFTREAVEGGTYAAPDASLTTRATWVRNWSAAEVVTAIAGAGMRVELLAEQTVTDNPLPWLERGADRLCRFPAGRPRYPLTYSLRARRAAPATGPATGPATDPRAGGRLTG